MNYNEKFTIIINICCILYLFHLQNSLKIPFGHFPIKKKQMIRNQKFDPPEIWKLTKLYFVRNLLMTSVDQKMVSITTTTRICLC